MRDSGGGDFNFTSVTIWQNVDWQCVTLRSNIAHLWRSLVPPIHHRQFDILACALFRIVGRIRPKITGKNPQHWNGSIPLCSRI